MMRSRRWLLAACLVLTGCERTELSAVYHSPKRLDQEVVVVVPESQTELLAGTVRALLGGGWREHRRAQANGQVRLTLTRRIDPRRYPQSVSATRQVIGPLRLRVEYGLTLNNRFSALAANDPLRLAAANIPTTVVLRAEMPGRIVEDGTNAGSVTDDLATWTVSLAELAAQPERYPNFTVRSRGWRLWLLLLIGGLGALILWVIWPALVPPSEVRERRAKARAERRERKAQATAARRERQAQAAEQKRAKQAAKQPPAPEAAVTETPAPVDAAVAPDETVAATGDSAAVTAPTVAPPPLGPKGPRALRTRRRRFSLRRR